MSTSPLPGRPGLLTFALITAATLVLTGRTTDGTGTSGGDAAPPAFTGGAHGSDTGGSRAGDGRRGTPTP
ncbi:hypothetical protein [Streptomyces sp. NPDC049906]|uniref:hypothetical protein n=1 Tax=Streptomyces sp. NPDC049906 TaxID=3155656 RepID=UPI00342D840A